MLQPAEIVRQCDFAVAQQCTVGKRESAPGGVGERRQVLGDVRRGEEGTQHILLPCARGQCASALREETKMNNEKMCWENVHGIEL